MRFNLLSLKPVVVFVGRVHWINPYYIWVFMILHRVYIYLCSEQNKNLINTEMILIENQLDRLDVSGAQG